MPYTCQYYQKAVFIHIVVCYLDKIQISILADTKN